MQITDDKAIYNLVTDVVGGPNVRKADNLWQLKCIGVCLALGIAVGAVLPFFTTWDRALCVLGGAFAGTLTGLFGSGIYLGLYRAIQHARGKHD